MNKLYFTLFLLAIMACGKQEKTTQKIDIQGHRGARGLVPENTLHGFLLATELGVSTLELDLVVSKDNQLIVSHEPFFSPEICLDTLGNTIPADSIINIYQLDYDQIQQFDCGSIGNKRFPDQKKLAVTKPLLHDLIDSVESYVKEKGLLPISYNIELKTQKETDTIFHPTPDVFSDLVYDLISHKEILARTTIQSFDFRTLQYFNKKYSDVKLALLIENELPWKVNIDSLGFIPNIYSCYYKLLSQQDIKDMHESNMQVIPWTINEKADIKQMISWGVDGVITDYPDRALEITKRNE